MAEEIGTQEGGQAQQVPQIQMSILGQYVRDMSFENVMEQKDGSKEGQPDISVQVNLGVAKRQQDNQYEVAIKLNVDAKTKGEAKGRGKAKTKAVDDVLFLMEIEYVGIFQIAGVPDEQLHPFLLIECPRMLFPFLRRIVSDVTRDGGFPPLNLDNIDFVALYRSELARHQAAQEDAKADA